MNEPDDAIITTEQEEDDTYSRTDWEWDWQQNEEAEDWFKDHYANSLYDSKGG